MKTVARQVFSLPGQCAIDVRCGMASLRRDPSGKLVVVDLSKRPADAYAESIMRWLAVTDC